MRVSRFSVGLTVGLTGCLMGGCGGTPLLLGQDTGETPAVVEEVVDGPILEACIIEEPVALLPAGWNPVAARDDGFSEAAVDPAGNLLVVWRESSDTSPYYRIWSDRYMPVDGVWEGRALAYEGDYDVYNRTLTVDASGRALLVGHQYDAGGYAVVASRLTATGWGPWRTLGGPGIDASLSSVTSVMNARGDALVGWNEYIYGDAPHTQTVTIAMHAEGTWGAQQTVTDEPIAYASGPRLGLAINDAGQTLATWFTVDEDYTFTLAASHGALDQPWGAQMSVQRLTESSYVWGPLATLSPAGDSTILWTHGTPENWESFELAVSRLPLIGSAWTTQDAISIRAAGFSNSFLRTSVSHRGNVGLLWWDSDWETADLVATSFTHDEGLGETTVLGADMPPVFQGCGPFEVAGASVAINDEGEMIALWEDMVQLENEWEFRFDIWAMDFAPGDGWGEPIQLNTEGSHGTLPSVVMGASGTGAAVWAEEPEAWSGQAEVTASMFGGR